ncbi:MAG TPA: SRPBCC family protein [Bryobacteraceae bacterium]|nr:SRPBCC family protein [Bryobacteraceae bacterium]
MEIIRHKYTTPNVGKIERGASVMAGSLLAYYGLRQKSWAGAGLAFLGLGFLRRGITGFCYTYQALGIRTVGAEQGRNVSVPYELGIRVDEAITVNRPRAEVYRFWRNLENLAEFMEHVESVRVLEGDRRSHWVAKGPGGRRMEWDAEIINEIPDELLAWRSLENSEVQNAGSVTFTDAAGGRGTEVRIELQYNPPGGAVGAFVAKLFGEEPSTQIHKDLKRLKTRLEAGVVPTTEGQPAGARKTEDDRERQAGSEKVGVASNESFPASDAPAYTH